MKSKEFAMFMNDGVLFYSVSSIVYFEATMKKRLRQDVVQMTICENVSGPCTLNGSGPASEI